ncbi:MAG TPA: GNAT family N-acetyltransferase [Planctomycetota bacterium]|nr:GNAT family N-acetyltransferase [Planctomycetota bacterium]
MASEQTRALGDADLPAVERLLRSQWPDIDWPRRFRRQWHDNPWCTPAVARGFVHEHAGALLGFFGSIPVRYQVDGRPGLACVATALCVHGGSRGRGIGRALVAAFDAQDAELAINATPNAATAAMFEQRGYTRVDPASGRHLLAHARQPYGAVRKAWRARGRGFLRTLARELRRGRPGGAPQLACAVLPAATGELDALWQAQREAHATTLWRSGAMLQWLLFAEPRNAVIACRDASGTLRGYAAFRAERGELRQIDVFPAHDDEVLAALGLAGAGHAASLGLGVVRLLSVPAAAAATLDAYGFEPVADDLGLLVRGSASGAPWFTRIDGDRWL